jgi:hypothetical protein
MSKSLHLLVSATLSLAACAYIPPPSPVRYEPAGPEDIWSDGMRLHPAPGGTGPLAFTSGFFETTLRTTPFGETFGTSLTFLIMAENRSAQPIVLDPMAFRAYLPAESLTLEPLDPEHAIRTANREVTDANGELVHARGLDAMVHLPLLLLDIASTGSKTPEQEKKDRQFWEDERKSAAERDARHQERMRLAGERRDQWSERALRKTTLLPGMRALGTVSFVENATAMRPDTLVLRYRGLNGREDGRVEGSEADLGRFGRIRDSVEDARLRATARFDSAHGGYFPKPGREAHHHPPL